MPEREHHADIVQEHFDHSYADYDRVVPMLVPGYRELKQSMISAIEKNVQGGSTILDMGCGTAMAAEDILLSANHYRYYGVDFSAWMVEEATKRLQRFGPQAALMRFDFLKLDQVVLPQLNAIISSLAIHHFNNKQEIYALVRKLLPAPQGVFILSDLVVDPHKDDAVMKFRRDHMRASGLSDKEIDDWFRIFDAEDRPSTIDENLVMLKQAGFKAQVTWQNPSYATFVNRAQ